MITALRVLLARLGALAHKARSDDDLDDEIRAHLEMLADEHVRRGLSPADARSAARRAFGAVEPMKEAYRDQRGVPFLEELAQDLPYAGRLLRRDPAFTTVAVLSLALGIAASTAGFSVFNAVMLRSLPVPSPQQLVLLQPQRLGKEFVLFNPIFEELRRRQRTLSGLFAINDHPFLKVTFDDAPGPTYLRASLVSGSYFAVLGLSPSLGRLLTDDDDSLPPLSGTAPCAAVISDQLWRRHFDGDPDAIGRGLSVRETVCSIVGVAPAAFTGHSSGGHAPDVWLPLRPLTDRKLLESPRMAFFSVMGRLAPGADIPHADAELTALYRQIQENFPESAGNPRQAPARPADFRMKVVPGFNGLDGRRREFGAPLSILLGMVGVVLVIAAANVSSLLLARGAARLPELATRAALGAGRGRLVRQLATESGLLAVLGGLFGGVLAWWAAPALGSLMSLGHNPPIAIDTTPDHRVLVFAIAATALAVLLSGILPALSVTRATLQQGMAREGRATVGHAQPLMRSLVAGQMALSLLLLTAAGLLLRTIVHLAGVDPGFRAEHVVLLDVHDETPGSSWGTVDTSAAKAHRAALYQTLTDDLNALPGVRSASVSWLGLFSAQNLWLDLVDADRPEDRPQGGRVDYVSPRYFETIGMAIVRGRGFTQRDREGTERVAVVNETLARGRFSGGEALGRRLALDYAGERERPFTVVGIVRDSKYNDVREVKAEPMIWVPISQAPYRISSVALRVEPGAEGSAARHAAGVLRAADRNLMVRRVTTLSAEVGRNTARERLLLGLSTGFGALALLLAGVGLFGTLSYAVSQRTREIGVRLAFGAQRRAIVGMVLRDALKLVVAAFVVGFPLALAGGYALRAFLFGVAPLDPAALAGACLVLALAALLAAYLPARRAAGVDAMVALRCE